MQCDFTDACMHGLHKVCAENTISKILSEILCFKIMSNAWETFNIILLKFNRYI